jgi:hypothetical protein
MASSPIETVQFSPVGRLEKFGEVAGNTNETDIIAAFQIPSATSTTARNRARIREFKVTAEKGASNSRFKIYKSNDGVAWTAVARLVIPDGGDKLESMTVPIIIPPGQYCKVTGRQATASGNMSAELRGETENTDITDV